MKVEVVYDAEDRVMSARNLESPKDNGSTLEAARP